MYSRSDGLLGRLSGFGVSEGDDALPVFSVCCRAEFLLDDVLGGVGRLRSVCFIACVNPVSAPGHCMFVCTGMSLAGFPGVPKVSRKCPKRV